MLVFRVVHKFDLVKLEDFCGWEIPNSSHTNKPSQPSPHGLGWVGSMDCFIFCKKLEFYKLLNFFFSIDYYNSHKMSKL